MSFAVTTLPNFVLRHQAAFLALLAVTLYMFVSGDAWAQPVGSNPGNTSNTPMGDVLCTVVSFVVFGNLGRGLATIAILTLGVGATIGKVSWGLAITVGVGIATMYGALSVASALVFAASGINFGTGTVFCPY